MVKKRLNGQLVNPVFVVIAGILALLIVYLVPLFMKKRIDGKVTDVVLSKEAIKPLSHKKLEEEITVSPARKIERDPFLPSYMKPEARPSGVFSPEELGFSLSGIMWDPENPVAIINGEVMRVGDVVNGKKILEIKKDSVIFGEGNARYTVTLWEQ